MNRSRDVPSDSVAERTSPSSASSPSHAILPHRYQVKNGGNKRKPNRKSRGGCITCKKRRVKCDETKPHCMRCIKFEVECDGYPDPDAPPPKKIIKRVPILLPKEQPPPSPQLDTIARAFGGTLNEIDGECFRLYLEETASQIHNVFPSGLWERLIPQISEVEPFVRHAIIALGALTKQSKADALQSLGGQGRTQTQHLQLALHQYDKSLRGMREAIADGQHDIRKALIACLLVFCLENMLGNQVSAAKHAESGLMLLYQSYNWTTTKGLHLEGPVVKTPCTDEALEDDIMEALDALDLQVLFFADNRNQSIHGRIKLARTGTIATMPTQINTMKDARNYWNLIMTRNYHFTKSIQRIDIDRSQQQRAETSPWEDSANIQTGELLLSDPDTPPASLQEEQMRYRMSIDRWTLATTQLFAKISSGTDEREKVGSAILQVQAKVNHIMLSGTFFLTEIAYDDFFRDFRTIVNLSEMIIPHILSTYDGAAPRFHFDVGIVPCLYLVASRCRNYEVRTRALELLFEANIREGIWDALAVAHMGKWIRDIEMEGLEKGDEIPEEKRAFLSAVNIDLYNKRAIVGATQRTKDGPVQTKALLTWGEASKARS